MGLESAITTYSVRVQCMRVQCMSVQRMSTVYECIVCDHHLLLLRLQHAAAHLPSEVMRMGE
jgi:hypothetical protein